MAQKIEMPSESESEPTSNLRFEGTFELGSAVSQGALTVLFGPDSNVNGKLAFDGAVRIDGTFQGSIRTGALTAGDGANITADVTCTSAAVRGTLVGNIVATEHVSLEGTAHVKGDISSPSLSVEKGVIFDGVSRMGTLPSKQRRPNRP